MARHSAVLDAEIGRIGSGDAAGPAEAGPVFPVESMVPGGRGVLLRVALWWVRRVASLRAPVELR